MSPRAMSSRAWISALAAVVVVGVLVLLDVIPLGLGGGVGRGGTGEGEDALAGRGEDDPHAASLRGRKKEGAEEEAPKPLEVGPPPIPTEARGTVANGAILRGRVVRAPGGIPVEGAQVLLRHPDPILTYLRASPKGRFDLLEARTGKDGRFAFLEIAPAKGYSVRAKAGSSASVSVENVDLRGRESKDLGDLSIGPEGKIEGRVADGRDLGVPGAHVAVSWKVKNPLQIVLADPATLPETEAATVTGADGSFALPALEPGEKTLVVLSDKAGSDVVQGVKVEAGKTTRVPDVRLAGEQVLAGRVEWEDGKPIDAARVFAGGQRSPAVRTMDTGPDGKFRLERLPEGKYQLGVLVPGLPVFLSDDHVAGEEDIVVRFAVPGSLRGVVVRKSDGKPVTRFGILLEPGEPGQGMNEFVRRLVDTTLGPQVFQGPDGRFDLARAPAGAYVVSVTADGYPTTKSESVTVPSGRTAEVKIELPDGNHASGVVRTSSGDLLERAFVYVIPGKVSEDARLNELRGVIEDRDPDVTTGADGAFTTSPQAPGPYELVATHPSAVVGLLRGVDLRAHSVDGLVIELKASGGLSGTVLDERGQPAAGEHVDVVYPDGDFFEAETDAQGEFRLESMAAGGCVVRWHGMNGYSKVMAVTRAEDANARRAAYDALKAEHGEQFVTEGAAKSVTLRLPHRVRFHGVVRRPAGLTEAPEGIWVQASDRAGGLWIPCDDRGEFDRLIEPGTYVLWRRVSDRSWEQEPLLIPDTVDHHLDFGR